MTRNSVGIGGHLAEPILAPPVVGSSLDSSELDPRPLGVISGLVRAGFVFAGVSMAISAGEWAWTGSVVSGKIGPQGHNQMLMAALACAFPAVWMVERKSKRTAMRGIRAFLYAWLLTICFAAFCISARGIPLPDESAPFWYAAMYLDYLSFPFAIFTPFLVIAGYWLTDLVEEAVERRRDRA